MDSEIKRVQPVGTPAPQNAFTPGVLVPLPGADFLFVTGQIATDAQGKVANPKDAKQQAEVVFGKIGKILEAAGLGFVNVVKAQIFLTDIKDFAVVSEVRNRYFAESRPASTLVEVSRLVHEDCCVEIEVIAVRLHGVR